jgi:radical SAM superfamily enzyme
MSFYVVERLNQTGNVVLEFGLQTIHKSEWGIINRPTNLKKVNNVLHDCCKRGIAVEVSLIFGVQIKRYILFNRVWSICKKAEFQQLAFPLMLLRGTPLYARRFELGLTESDEPVSDSIPRQQAGISHVVSSLLLLMQIGSSLTHYNQSSPNKWKLGNCTRN